MSTNIQTWYNFVLQQMAAESYLDGWNNLTGAKQVEQLMYGSNNPTFQSLPFDNPILPGATRMTATQAYYFLQNYRIVNQLPNTASGFSATLMEKLDPATGLGTGEYTISIRSTEFFDPTQGGDWARDGLPGADGEIGTSGFAFGQIASMESYYEHLKLGESFDSISGQWVHDPALDSFSAAFGGSAPAPEKNSGSGLTFDTCYAE